MSLTGLPQPNRDARPLLRVFVMLVAGCLAVLGTHRNVLPPREAGDLGLAFGDAPLNLSNSPGAGAEGPRLVVTEGGSVHVVWQEDADSSLGSDLITRRKVPAGAWSAPAVLEYSGRQPAITSFDKDEVAVAYVGGYSEPDGSLKMGIYVKAYDPSQHRWPLAGKPVPGGDGGVQPDVVQAEGRLWLVWVDTSTGSRRTAWQSRFPSGTPAPRGSTFDGIINNAQSPRIAAAVDQVGSADLHVAWMDESAQDSWITHLWMAAAAPTPQVNGDLGPYYAQGLPRLPDIAASDRSTICLAWQEVVPLPPPDRRQDIVRSCSPWQEAFSESETGRPAADPSIDMDRQLGLLLAWRQEDGGTPGAGRGLRYRQELPPHQGNIWEGEASQPDIVYDRASGDVHAVWLARVPGSDFTDVFYARWRPLLPSPSPSVTVTASMTASATRSPVPTRSPSATRTPTVDPRRTPEATPTRGTPATPTRTPTGSRTPIETATRTTPTPRYRLYCPRLEQHVD
ncbi:MAG TPA: hypothetical protein PK826_02970 [Anaerolineae bacterium]|nr:hypothetical protein [Anaerolineae bacterium]